MSGTALKAACYVRVSTENQLDNYSIEEQTRRLEAYCASKGWAVSGVYADGGYSGGNTERPALRKMLGDIRGGQVDIVLVHKLDRLSRSQKDTLTLIEDGFLRRGVEFVSVSENFDTSTGFGRAMIGMLSVFAQLEKEQITERLTMGRVGRGRAGLYHGGPVSPTGYTYAGGRLVVDEYKAAQVREVFGLFLSGHGVSAIRRRMDERYGGWSSHSLVSGILRNTVYIGKVKFNQVQYDGVHEAIVDPAVFRQAQALLRGGRPKAPLRSGCLLTGLVRCARCGARYSANHGYYKCYSRAKSDQRYIADPDCKNKHWEIARLDGVILAAISALRYDPARAGAAEPPVPGASALKRRVTAAGSQISRLIGLCQAGGASAGEIAPRIAALRQEQEALSRLLSQPAGERSAAAAPYGPRAVSPGSGLEEQRMLAGGLIQSVSIDGERLHIRWRI
ncbi:MAG: recombinase family protein [Oscillospiraceae bacterium]|nr:recombinase family protein [Oscillospiraceae bacterium]